ncbi:hypothetical protein FP2506_04260 [Fulvimarina pelagi HTCC2506]|uniref:Uncharacterized protein n=1 Tax=Fulvimarina pelagi HTCC2506 TaxID=314231 RepID=Q0FZ66_9HYPH|nr:hypothetical protein FP2506_04260 [Fulvimarina pelagi HTCC2506]
MRCGAELPSFLESGSLCAQKIKAYAKVILCQVTGKLCVAKKMALPTGLEPVFPP